MAKADIFLTRSLRPVQAHGVTALGAIGWDDPAGGQALRVFFKSGTPPELFVPAPGGGCARIAELRSINGGAMLLASQDTPGTTARIGLTPGEISVPTVAPETDLFDGMNTCIAERNQEPPEVFADWLRYHVERFALQGLVILDRAPFDETDNIRAEFARIAARHGLERCVHLSVEAPLGADLPAASHPFNAPDAPGKDRMGVLQPDPQFAPLAELSLYEYVRWRFLSRARAVMNIDLTDVLQPGANPFDAAQEAAQGVVALLGQRIYPWRIREGEAPGFGDHICRQFDNPRANRRWCVAPARLPRDTVWRLVRIGNAEPETPVIKGFWRAMSIRHPQANIAEIVPKTSLIEAPELLEQARETWDANPVRPPQSEMDLAPAKATDAGRTVIVTCMKNEGPFIMEWVAYHRAIGVDDFLIYTNDCTDGTDTLLDLLQARGIVQRRDNPFKGSGLKPQHAALAAAETEPVVQNAGWGISMDVDEFINVRTGSGRLRDLYAAVGEANMISLTWRLFGNDNVHGFEDRFLIDQFTRCAPELARKPHQAWGFKTLFRNIGIYKKMGVHRPKGLKPDLWDQIKWVNGSGRPMPRKLLRNGWRSTTDSYGYDLVALNHYAVRSAESFLVKRDRGRVNHVDRDQGLSYWFRMNNNWEEEHSIQGKRALLQDEYDTLMADPELAAAHTACVAAHRAKIAELRAQPNYETFYTTLCSPRMERLSRMHQYFGANVFLAGPDSVPDHVVWQDPIPRKFFYTVPKTETTH